MVNELEELLKEINEQIEVFQTESTTQFEKDNKSAGARARKATNSLTKLFKEFRKLSIAE